MIGELIQIKRTNTDKEHLKFEQELERVKHLQLQGLRRLVEKDKQSCGSRDHSPIITELERMQDELAQLQEKREASVRELRVFQ